MSGLDRRVKYDNPRPDLRRRRPQSTFCTVTVPPDRVVAAQIEPALIAA